METKCNMCNEELGLSPNNFLELEMYTVTIITCDNCYQKNTVTLENDEIIVSHFYGD